MRAKSETRQHGMSAPANIHGQGRSPIRTQEATKHHTGPSQSHHTPHHTPARRTVRPADGQTRAKRTPGRVIARKRVRSPYSEPEREMRQVCAEHTGTNGAHSGLPTAAPHPTRAALADKRTTPTGQNHHCVPHKPQRHARKSSAHTKNCGARGTWKTPSPRAPHADTR